MKVLIATTNPGKFHEFTTEFKDLSFEFVSLRDLGLHNIDAEEPFNTTWENAMHKAKFYGDKCHLLTIAEDSGVFIRHLNGAPGVHTKRAAPTEEDRIHKIITLLKGVKGQKRRMTFKTSACVYDPTKKSFNIFNGEVSGLVVNKAVPGYRPGMEHDAIFYYPPLKKTFAELGAAEKNLVSHRGKVLNQLKYFLAKQYSFKQILVPLALVCHKRRLLLLKRRDARKEFNNVWEFPGGGVEDGESVEKCVKREVLEETGYRVKIASHLPGLPTSVRKKYNYQVFLTIFVCTVLGGNLRLRDNETNDSRWVTIREAIKLEQFPLNKKIIKDNTKLLKKYCD